MDVCVPLLEVEVDIVFSTHRGDCPSARCRGGLTLYTEYKVSPIHRRESAPSPFLYTEERVSSLHRGELVPLVYVEAADSSSIQMRECILYTVKRVSLCYL